MLATAFRTVPPPALWLGLAGLVPFIAGAGLAWVAIARDAAWLVTIALQAQQAYGAVILSFMGAVHWGLAVAGHGGARPDWRMLGIAVLPALAGWVALLLAGAAGTVLLLLGFAGIYLYDQARVRAGHAPAWYPDLRQPLTGGVLLSLAAALVAELVR